MSRSQRDVLATRLGTPQPAAPRPIGEMRAGFASFMATMRIAPVTTSETTLGGRRAVLVEGSRPGTILYFHGGSFIVGSPETAMSLTSALVTRTGVRALSLDYRLGPEHPYPAAIEDGLAAYRELLGTGPIALAGDSAGANLAVVTALAARDAGLPMPAAIVAFSGAFDFTRSGESYEGKRGIDPFFTRETLEGHTPMYLNGERPDQPLLSPAICGELAGLPPMLIQVGTNEVLLDDSTRLARRAWAAGVDVILDVTANVPHVFQAFTGTLDEADEALDRAAHFLGQRLS